MCIRDKGENGYNTVYELIENVEHRDKINITSTIFDDNGADLLSKRLQLAGIVVEKGGGAVGRDECDPMPVLPPLGVVDPHIPHGLSLCSVIFRYSGWSYKSTCVAPGTTNSSFGSAAFAYASSEK